MEFSRHKAAASGHPRLFNYSRDSTCKLDQPDEKYENSLYC